MLADELDYVVGVDTHRDEHVFAVVATATGAALRLLLVARRSAVDVRREALGQLRGVIVTAPDRLREELRVLPTGRLLERCSRLRRSSTAEADELATRLVLRSLARRIDAATHEAAELEREILAHVRALAP